MKTPRFTTNILDLPHFHPELLWTPIQAAVFLVLSAARHSSPVRFPIAISLPDWEESSDALLLIDFKEVSPELVDQVRRTFEAPRLVELAAIGVAGLALYHFGEYKIIGMAPWGTSGDYLVEGDFILEVAGRSRKKDLVPTWRQKWDWLQQSESSGMLLFVAEFETPSGRFEFVPGTRDLTWQQQK